MLEVDVTVRTITGGGKVRYMTHVSKWLAHIPQQERSPFF
jgi:hypothetical protein